MALKTFVLRHRFFSAVIGIAAISLAGWFSPAIWAHCEARWDVAHGRMEIRTYGYPASWRDDFARFLQERHGIKLAVVGCCVVSPFLIDSVDAYNRVSEQAVKDRFGRDVMAECAAEAARLDEIRQRRR